MRDFWQLAVEENYCPYCKVDLGMDCISRSGKIFNKGGKPHGARIRLLETLEVRYSDYIRSRSWKEKRNEFLASNLFEDCCAACREKKESYNVHHMTYERLGAEQLEDLVALCARCHNDLHKFHAESNSTLWEDSHLFIKRKREDHGKVSRKTSQASTKASSRQADAEEHTSVGEASAEPAKAW